MGWQDFIKAVADANFEFPWQRPLIVAQAILESGRGTTDLSRYNNMNGMKYRKSIAVPGAESFWYPTDSEPDPPGGDWFFQFDSYETGINVWKKFYFRKDEDWIPYPKVYERDPQILKNACSFLNYIGPIYCPYFENSHDVSYADYIMEWFYPEAESLLQQIGENDFMLLQVGSQGSQVGQLQAKLNEIGFDCGNVDKIFGPKTEKAVKNFQRDHLGESEVTGIVDQDTWNQVMNHPSIRVASVLIDPGHSPIHGGTEAKDGTPEYDMNLLQAKIVKAELEKANILSEIFDPANDDRPLIGQKAADHSMFLSLHHNATDKTPHYTCVMVHPTKAKPRSPSFAKKLSTAVANAIGQEDFGVMQYGVTVLSESEDTNCPICVLCESYFLDAIDTREEAEQLSTKAAYAIASTVIAELQPA
jgi:N-acetylmuramoyl-L-alanine amidase